MSKFLITLSNFYLLLHRFLYCFTFWFFFGALITSNYGFLLDFLFSLRLLLYAAVCCVCVVFFVYRFTFYSKLFTWAISCFLLFVCYYLFFFCWAVSVRIERGP